MKTYIVVTVDTEADLFRGKVVPISKMVYGDVNGERYGITGIMDICERYNFKATFFVSTFETSVLGDNEMKEACMEIHGRGHDVQLHTHPKWITNKRFMWNHSLEKQHEMLSDGKETIHRWIGEYPVAHRAGGFGADHNTLKALKNLDIPVDSSDIGSPYCRLDKNKFNSKTVQISDEGIMELPVTRFAQFRIGSFQPTKPFDINANTLSELKFVISAAKAKETKVVTLLMHSFSFLNRNKDRTKFTPNRSEMIKFERFLEFIKKDTALEIITVKDFYKLYSENPRAFTGQRWLPVSGYFRTVIRALRYVNRGRGNQLIVASIALFVLSSLLFIVFLRYIN